MEFGGRLMPASELTNHAGNDFGKRTMHEAGVAARKYREGVTDRPGQDFMPVLGPDHKVDLFVLARNNQMLSDWALGILQLTKIDTKALNTFKIDSHYLDILRSGGKIKSPNHITYEQLRALIDHGVLNTIAKQRRYIGTLRNVMKGLKGHKVQLPNENCSKPTEYMRNFLKAVFDSLIQMWVLGDSYTPFMVKLNKRLGIKSVIPDTIPDLTHTSEEFVEVSSKRGDEDSWGSDGSAVVSPCVVVPEKVVPEEADPEEVPNDWEDIIDGDK